MVPYNDSNGSEKTYNPTPSDKMKANVVTLTQHKAMMNSYCTEAVWTPYVPHGWSAALWKYLVLEATKTDYNKMLTWEAFAVDFFGKRSRTMYDFPGFNPTLGLSSPGLLKSTNFLFP